MKELFDQIVDAECENGRAWAILLAGGDGRRLEAEAVRRYGYPRPKQYCAFDDSGVTLLERTVARALRVVPEHRIVASVTATHRGEAHQVLGRFPKLQRVEQPQNRSTTPGILLPILHILARDPGALVYVLPSDHEVSDDVHFMLSLAGAAPLVADRIILLGATPGEIDEGYGWVLPESSGRLARVRGFREKPPSAQVLALRAQGALVNTFAMMGRATTFARLCRSAEPAWWTALVQGIFDPKTLEEAYRTGPASDFSRRVLENNVGELLLSRLDASVQWSDLGTLERLKAAQAA